MAAAYATLVSAMNIINSLHHHPRPPISLHIQQVESLTQKIHFLLEFLEGYNPHRDYSKEADPLESRIADAAYAAEHTIESRIQASSIPQQSSIVGADDVKLQMRDELTSQCYDLSKIKKIIKKKIKKIRESWSPTSNGENVVHLEKMVEDMASIEEEAKQIQGRVELQHQLHTNSTPSDSSRSSSILQQSSMAGADNGENVSYDGLYEALEKVIKDMASIEEEAKQIQGRVGVQHQPRTKPTPLDSSRSSSIPQQSSMVGAEDVKREMIDKLTSHCHDLQIIPIVGMGGSGKTTLARTIYGLPSLKKHFHSCAWATISQEYSIREIFASVLRQFNIEVDDNLRDHELGNKLYQHLFHRRFLIIMDDMWSIDAWDRVRNYFPNNKNGSRIVVTTRLSDLASKLSNFDIIGMKLLDEAESWELLSKTVFGKEGCPLELDEIGKKIGKSCRGLPLSIVVVGGLLAKSKRERECWEEIGENLNASVNLDDDERCLKVLYMSYKQLPIHLKPCFLYMGAFPEDEEIVISDLIKYWVAEGFVKAVCGKSLEEIAKEYLKDLIGRNLVLSSTRNLEGKKWCQIHDLLRDLCLREAEKERFYNRASDNVGISVLPPISQARSLTWNVEREISPLNMSLLRIVKTTTRYEWIEKDLFEHVDQLVNSRFLEIGFRIIRERIFPCSIWRFWNLQTLIVKEVNVVTAPTDFWYMPSIRHVEVTYELRLTDPPNDQDDIVLENLQSLGRVEDFKCSEQVVKKIPNIKELEFRNCGKSDDEMYCLRNLDCLTKLESLYGLFRGTRVINFPHSLKKLILCTDPSSFLWGDILDKVGVLPHLQKLSLEQGRFKKGKWETTEGQFRSLKFLYLYGHNLKIWKIESSHFPCLERLHLQSLKKLREIPLEFAEIPTLREIDVDWCMDSAMVSAKRISEEHEDYYGEGALQVRVEYRRQNTAAEVESLASPNFFVKQIKLR